MNLSSKDANIYANICGKSTQLQELRKIAKEIKKDHALAMELWSTEAFLPRMLAILIMDKNLLSQELIDKLDKEMRTHPKEEQTRLVHYSEFRLTYGLNWVCFVRRDRTHHEESLFPADQWAVCAF